MTEENLLNGRSDRHVIIDINTSLQGMLLLKMMKSCRSDYIVLFHLTNYKVIELTHQFSMCLFNCRR